MDKEITCDFKNHMCGVHIRNGRNGTDKLSLSNSMQLIPNDDCDVGRCSYCTRRIKEDIEI